MADRSREDTILAFLAELWPDGIPAGMALVLFHLGTHVHRLVRDLAEAARLLALGAFVCFACALVRTDVQGRGTANDSVAIPGFWLDLDLAGGSHAKTNLPTLDEALGFIDSLPLPPTLVLHSGGGFYLWWAFREPWTFDNEAERVHAQNLVSAWQSFIHEQAAAHGWDLDDTSPLNQLLRPEGALNTKYSPPRGVKRIRTSGLRWNPCDFEEWRPQLPARDLDEVELPKELKPWLARAIQGLGVPTREVRSDGLLRAVVLRLCPACGGVQQTERGLVEETAHVAPLSGALRCKRQSCEARESGDGGLGAEEWITRFLPKDVAGEVDRLRSEASGRNGATVPDLVGEGAESVPLAEADAGRLGAVIDQAIEHAQGPQGRAVALVVATLGAGKTKAIVSRLQRHRGAYFARSHRLLEEVAYDLDRLGVSYAHVEGVGKACRFLEAFEHYGRRSDWRGTACQTCPHKDDGSCAAWGFPDKDVILAAHESLPVLRDMRIEDESTGESSSPLDHRLIVLDEGADFVEVIVVDRERLRVPLNNPGCFGRIAWLAEKITRLLDSLAARVQRDRHEQHRGQHPTRYTAAELRGYWKEVTEDYDSVKLGRYVASAANVQAQDWPKPSGAHLRELKLEKDLQPHPDLLKVWRALPGVLSENEEERLHVQEDHGVLEIVATDDEATVEIRSPWRITLPKGTGAVVLDATGRLTLAELKAANPKLAVKEFALNVLPAPEARILRVHVRTTNVTRKRLLDQRKCTARALGTLGNALREVDAVAQSHLGAGQHACGLLTYKPIADALVADPATLSAALPPGVALTPERVGYYGRDERGSNRFAGLPVLVTFGDPIPNIGAVAADGRALNLLAQDLVETRTAAALVQAHGRSRALRARGPVVLAHVGSMRPADWTDCLELSLPMGRPAGRARESVRKLVEALLANGDVVAVPIVEALSEGRLPHPEPLAECANRRRVDGTFRQCPPPRRTLFDWVREAALRLGALASEIRLPTGTPWTVWRPRLMPPEGAEARARRAWELINTTHAGAEATAPRPAGDQVCDLEAALLRAWSGNGAAPDLEPWRDRYEERAGIRQFCGGFGRAEAERLALEATVAAFVASQGGGRDGP